MADLSIAEQYDNQVRLLQDYYNTFNDDDIIDEMTLAEVKTLVKNIYDTEVILHLLDNAGVRGKVARDITNIARFGNKYQNYGLTGFEEAADAKKNAKAKNIKRQRKGIFSW